MTRLCGQAVTPPRRRGSCAARSCSGGRGVRGGSTYQPGVTHKCCASRGELGAIGLPRRLHPARGLRDRPGATANQHSRRRPGVHERAFLRPTPKGDLVIVTLEGDDHGAGVRADDERRRRLHDLVHRAGQGDPRRRSDRADDRVAVRACRGHGPRARTGKGTEDRVSGPHPGRSGRSRRSGRDLISRQPVRSTLSVLRNAANPRLRRVSTLGRVGSYRLRRCAVTGREVVAGRPSPGGAG